MVLSFRVMLITGRLRYVELDDAADCDDICAAVAEYDAEASAVVLLVHGDCIESLHGLGRATIN